MNLVTEFQVLEAAVLRDVEAVQRHEEVLGARLPQRALVVNRAATHVGAGRQNPDGRWAAAIRATMQLVKSIPAVNRRRRNARRLKGEPNL